MDSFSLLFFIFSPFKDVDRAYAYVSIDINPSIELQINKEEQVLQLMAFNQKGKEVLSHIQYWKGEEFPSVIESIVRTIKELGYMDPKNDIFLLSSAFEQPNQSEKEEESRFYTKMKTDLKLLAKQLARNGIIRVHHVETPIELRNEANRKGMSAGKYALITGMLQEEPNIDELKWIDLSIADIEKETGNVDKVLDKEITEEEWKQKKMFVKEMNIMEENKPPISDPVVPEEKSEKHLPYRLSSPTRPYEEKKDAE